MSWTEPRVDLLKVLWADRDLSAAQIAAELGGVTKNAVIGKAHRLGLPGRPVVQRPRGPMTAKRKSPQHARAERLRKAALQRPSALDAPELATEALPEFDDTQIPVAQRRTLLQLTHCTCKYPVGDPLKPDFFFCGGATFEDLPYCAQHQLRVGGGFGGTPSREWRGRYA